MSKQVVMVARDGREYVTSDPVEVTRLKSHGYTVKQAEKPASKQAEKPANK